MRSFVTDEILISYYLMYVYENAEIYYKMPPMLIITNSQMSNNKNNDK